MKGEQSGTAATPGRTFIFSDNDGNDWHVYFTADFSGTVRFHTGDDPAIQVPYEIIRQVAASIVRIRKITDINAADDDELLK